MVEKKQKEARNIGLNVKKPENTCEDNNCPFHGTLPVRGQVITGVISSYNKQGTVKVKKEFMNFVSKYERYEKRTSSYAAHCPPCIVVKAGDRIRIAECRPISKTKSFVVVEKI